MNKLNVLLDILSLEQQSNDIYVGKNYFIGSPNVYGGQVLAQATYAACQTVVDTKTLHSLHSYFLHPGNNEFEIVYTVQRIKEGKSFSTRRVIASQRGKEIFVMVASFQIKEEGIEHHTPMPNVAKPESLTSFSDIFAQLAEKMNIQPTGIFAADGPFQFFPVEHYDPFKPKLRSPLNHTWFKTSDIIAPDILMNHLTTLVYASDFNLLITALFPHGLSFFTTPMQIASLDHAMWFHRPPKTDEWLLYVVEGQNANASRALCSGKIYAENGDLIASTVQEGLIRIIK